ncbi:MAG: cytochrome c3 family protein [Candidatus Marinimicrobia bacterium]|nr:cytochrome c3 family protein [Candidatus Neomarinimicrobiota bacterium]
MNKRYLIVCLLSCLIPTLVWGQLSRNRNDEKECVICHAQWHHDLDNPGQLLPEISTSTIIDGKPAVVSDREMCISCHDGYVMDSREVFSSTNHQVNLDKTHINVQGLPLGAEDEIYCGTCHTPHALKPERAGGLAPFLRVEVNNSAMCLDCHSDQAANHASHPIHVQVTQHNLPGNPFFGENEQLECMTCHPIHGDQGVTGVAGKDRSELCSACHEPYFNIQLTDHDLTTTLQNKNNTIGPSLEDQDVCAPCHISHNGGGEFMWFTGLEAEAGKNGYCLSCHMNNGLAREKSITHSGHPVGGQHLEMDIPALGINAGDKLLCTSCHDPHQWEYSQKHAAVTATNEEGSEYTSFLRLPDDAQGQLCTACHHEQKMIKDSDHSVVREGFQQHFRSTGAFNGQCSVCHDTHGAAGLKVTGANDSDLTRSLCESCHTEVHYPTTVGGFDHPMGMQLQVTEDLPTHAGELTCITCHDPHQWGAVREHSQAVDLVGNDANSFLRISNWPEPGLCLSCHEEQGTVLKTDHDLSDGDQNACSFCHTAHNSKTEFGILSVWDEAAGETYNEKFCFSCHQAEASGAEKVPLAWNHPHEYGTLTHNARGTGDWIDFPLFDRDKPGEMFGFVDCFTCHDPHQWSFKEAFRQPLSENDEGDYMTSFLRNPSHKTLCTDCHGANTLWKYNYYHDPVKRKRY